MSYKHPAYNLVPNECPYTKKHSKWKCFMGCKSKKWVSNSIGYPYACKNGPKIDLIIYELQTLLLSFRFK
jgi:hypothetical protein